jgi:HD-GYP domain-containing protein (c-di-GMP phosphodiesterase class II)
VPRGEALNELYAHAGTQFDPAVVAVFGEVVTTFQPEIPAAPQVRAILSAASAAPTSAPTA